MNKKPVSLSNKSLSCHYYIHNNNNIFTVVNLCSDQLLDGKALTWVCYIDTNNLRQGADLREINT